MTLPVFPNPISLNQVNVELGLAGTTLISLNQASVRTLAGVPSGAISMNNLHGKSNRVSIVYNITSDLAGSFTVNVASVPGYVAGLTDITVNVSAGIYVYRTDTSFQTLMFIGGTAGDAIVVNNSGYILGCGGAGGSGSNGSVSPGTPGFGGSGSGAVSCIACPASLTVNNAVGAYIAGGGGGGAGGFYAGGGGGAGGGVGGGVQSWIFSGGAGGGPGLSGQNGAFVSHPTYVTVYSGGGGGRVLPGSTTFAGAFILSKVGYGGTAGGVGAGNADAGELGGYGGGPSQAGEAMMNGYSAGGGGGWGAAGGSTPAASGGNAGYAIARPSGVFTLNNSGTIYGAIL